MRRIFPIVYFLFLPFATFSQVAEKDYTAYHRAINKAEEEIFIRNDSIAGLKIFRKTFEEYDFVYVDDCIEAFQLALYFKRDDDAIIFIKKALDNGFELKLLDELIEPGSYTKYGEFKKVTIHHEFIRRHGAEMEAYSASCYNKYLKRIDKDLFYALLRRHVREQLYKNYHAELGFSMKDQLAMYYNICDDNLRFIDSLAAKNIFCGERNLGLYTDKLCESLHLPYKTIQRLLESILQYYGLPRNTYVPIVTELDDYYGLGPVYNMLFHNPKSYITMAKYKDAAIKKGYMHPREYASLKYNVLGHNDDLYLQPIMVNEVTDTKNLNERRSALLLTSYEIDLKKHQFEQSHHLQLLFGFRNGTR